jgi:hypothetical protein
MGVLVVDGVQSEKNVVGGGTLRVGMSGCDVARCGSP